MERNKREVEEELITIIKKSELDLGTIKIIKEKVMQWLCVHIFARKRGLELFSLVDTSNKIQWLEVEQIQPLNEMRYFSWEGNK